jgi:hypothetical protein
MERKTGMAYPLVVVPQLTTDDMPVVTIEVDVGIGLHQEIVDIELQALIDSISGLGPKN